MEIKEIENRVYEFSCTEPATSFLVMVGQEIIEKVPALDRKATLANPAYSGYHFVMPVRDENGNIVANYEGASFEVPECL